MYNDSSAYHDGKTYDGNNSYISDMRLLMVLVFIVSTCYCEVLGQTALKDQEKRKRYRRITKRSQKAPENLSQSTFHLSTYLTSPAKTDLEKTRSIFVWIAYNIIYDMKGFKSGNLPDYRPKAVLLNRNAVCEGYARLFNELCNEAGVRSEIIRGYSKGYGYDEGDRFAVTNHAWNAVFLDSAWQLIDVTWAAKNSNESSMARPFDNKYFLSDPKVFINDHLPEIPAWQLLSNPITKEEFESGSISISSGEYNYQDSLKYLLNLDPGKQAITYQLKSKKFNPENDYANYKLGVEFRFRALDSLEAVYKVEEKNMYRFNVLEKSVFSDLDEAALYFTLIKPPSRYYESAMNFLDDTDMERGIFKYEVAHRMLEIYATFSEEKKNEERERYEGQILQYYSEAAEYFELIPMHSWYYESAQSYLKFYLDNPFNTELQIHY